MSSKIFPPLGPLEKGLFFVMSAPGGTGKTTLARMLCKEFPCVVESISYTTRPIRKGEIEEVDYYFISREEFERKIKDEEFLEYASIFGNLYGTSRTFIEKAQEAGRHMLLVIDTQGALQLMKKIPAVFIFIAPPSLEELKKRLLQRGSEDWIMQSKRVSGALKELEEASFYDYWIVNDQLEIAYDALRSILIAEEHRTRRKLEKK